MHTESGFKAFYLEYAEGLRNFLYYKTGDVQQAADLMQEAFVRLWQKRTDVQPEKAKSFLFTVANRLFLDKVRHQKVGGPPSTAFQSYRLPCLGGHTWPSRRGCLYIKAPSAHLV